MRLRFVLRLVNTFFTRFKALILLSTALGVLLFLFLPTIKALVPALGRGEVVGLVGRYSLEDLPLAIQEQISIGLTTIDEEQNVRRGLASKWRSEEEGRVWFFELGGNRWQDGRKVVAGDITYNFTDVELEVVGEQTLKFILKDPFSPFPSVVARPTFRRGLLGAGEWEVVRLDLINNHFIEELQLKNITTRNVRTYRFYPTEDAAKTAFKLGEIDALLEIVELSGFETWPNVEAAENIRQDRYVGVFFNLNDTLVAEKDLRQALAYATNKERFGGVRALGPINPDSWAFNSQVKPYAYDVARAKNLLSKLSDSGEELTINLVTTPPLLSIADKIKEDWEAIGVATQIQVSNTPPADFQALVAIQAIPSDPDQYSLWHSKQAATNITNYGEQEEDTKPKESQRIDKLLEDGRRTLDQEERKKIYIDFQRFLVEDSPVIFLYHPSTYTVRRK